MGEMEWGNYEGEVALFQITENFVENRLKCRVTKKLISITIQVTHGKECPSSKTSALARKWAFLLPDPQWPHRASHSPYSQPDIAPPGAAQQPYPGTHGKYAPAPAEEPDCLYRPRPTGSG
ncbi:uncharacterized protein CANTADRAFT_23845 [Suhomyces tanzawaensis NRRL Y-17324]|uniref:Uncharacterized protein n=1 Tax=Suhomyces tanzawaensis NRRL Y-17324 TaxID=984487 RepID=A0A1E4SBV9_9ASCO|nr:uncharacterized protein CANTADRAFT_23845 [Suhomyces tanzawaensis NRRL Y-17324]ODV77007.1 hypothetical protein CANTADRAFT_23845 [Suhomyces tanzawaensis NRRL Y-17324]